jgi:hypothetical protein
LGFDGIGDEMNKSSEFSRDKMEWNGILNQLFALFHVLEEATPNEIEDLLRYADE